MTLTNWQLSREFLDSKIEYILNAQLNNQISTFNTSIGMASENQLETPQQIVVGVDSIRLEAASNPVDYPVCVVYEVGSRNNVNDIVDSQDDVITYEIVYAVASDAGNIAWAAKSAKYGAMCALTALEKYLPDAPGATGTCVTYRVDPTNTAQYRTVPIKQGHLYMSAYAVRFDAYTRTQINYDPFLKDPNYVADPYVESLFDVTEVTPPVVTDTGVTVALDATPNNLTTCTLTAAQLAAATDIRMSGITVLYGVPDASPFSVVNQTTFETYSGTISASLLTVPIASVSISDGDEWVIVLKHSTFNIPIYYSLEWNVT